MGRVVLLGRPNSGKSTLLNALIGENLSMVSAKPQSTWTPVIGVRTDAEVQLVFEDPPGIIDPTQAMHDALIGSVRKAVSRAHAALYLVPCDVAVEQLDTVVPPGVVVKCPSLIVRSKADDEDYTATEGVAVSAHTGRGIPELLEWCRRWAPLREFAYPPDEIGTQPVRFFAAEYVREAVFEHVGDELPYATAVEVDEFREGSAPIYIRMTAYVERESQKGMLIGKGGTMLKAIGAMARVRLEHLLGEKVYLDLWVKVKPKWRKNTQALREFGYLRDED
ncbi:MAG: GTPase Era [Gemmatimonadales bacterium]